MLPVAEHQPRSIPSDSDIAIGPSVINSELVGSNLIAMRRRHDSEVVKHKGNERHIIHLDELRLDLTDKTKSGGLKASACSKIIAVCFKNLEEVPTGEARRHRWNINIKLNLSGIVKDTATFSQVHLQGLLDGGEIKRSNPLKPGRFIIAIKNHVRCWSFHTFDDEISDVFVDLIRRLCTWHEHLLCISWSTKSTHL